MKLKKIEQNKLPKPCLVHWAEADYSYSGL